MLRPIAVQADKVGVASEPHESVKLVNFHVINTPINTIDSLKHKRNTLKLGVARSALEDLSLDNS